MAKFRAVEFATLTWVDWFNNRRLLEPIGNIPPGEAEERYYAMPKNRPWQRDSNDMASGKPGAVHCTTSWCAFVTRARESRTGAFELGLQLSQAAIKHELNQEPLPCVRSFWLS